MARGRARVTHPRFGSVVVPCCSKLGAIENAAEYWRVSWQDLSGAEVWAAEPSDGPLRLPREFQWIRRMTRKEEAQGMTNFEKITRSPEVLADFLNGITAVDCQWDHDFARAFCDACPNEDCDKFKCPHMAERDNPLWWLRQEASETVKMREQVRLMRAEAYDQGNHQGNCILATQLMEAADTIEKLIGNGTTK